MHYSTAFEQEGDFFGDFVNVSISKNRTKSMDFWCLFYGRCQSIIIYGSCLQWIISNLLFIQCSQHTTNYIHAYTDEYFTNSEHRLGILIIHPGHRLHSFIGRWEKKLYPLNVFFFFMFSFKISRVEIVSWLYIFRANNKYISIYCLIIHK